MRAKVLSEHADYAEIARAASIPSGGESNHMAAGPSPEAATSFSAFPTSRQTMLLVAHASWWPPHDLLRRARSLLLVAHALLLDAHTSWWAPHVISRRAHVMLPRARTSWWPPRSLLPRASMQPRDVADVRAILTPKEFEIFALMGRGMLSKEIAAALGSTTNTAQTHRKTIATKLGTTGNELVQQAVRYHEKNLETAQQTQRPRGGNSLPQLMRRGGSPPRLGGSAESTRWQPSRRERHPRDHSRARRCCACRAFA